MRRRCVDCRYHRAGFVASLNRRDCDHPQLRRGPEAQADAAHERTALGRCGPLGQYWEPKIGVTATLGIRG